MKAKLILMFLGAGLIMASCTKYPPSSDRLLEDLAIYTKYDTKADFASYKTYYMNDSVMKVADDDSGWYYNSQVQSLMDRIASNMKKFGYTRTYNKNATDLYMGVSVVKNINVTVYYPGWYYPYYPSDWWYWGGYYPYYPYYPAYITSYSSGSIIMDMMDIKNRQGDQVAVVWNGFVRGLMTGSHTLPEIEQSIDQAFSQTKGFQGN